MPEELARYFSEYAAAYNAFDAERLATFFYCPCLMVNGDFVAQLETQEAILDNFEALLRHHESGEFGSASVADISSRSLGSRLYLATIRWEVARPDGSPLWEFSNTYNLVNHGAGWKIIVSTTHETAA